MKIISLTQDYLAIIDDEDYEELSKYKWMVADVEVGRPKVWRWSLGSRTERHSIIMAREILNAPANVVVDHKNGNTLDNRKSNIRLCTYSQNNQNRRKTKRKTSSKYKGVTLDRKDGAWQAVIGFIDVFGHATHKYLGRFPSEEEAARYYDEVARKYFGKFAALNFPKEGERSCL